jgi:hypothetical protein
MLQRAPVEDEEEKKKKPSIICIGFVVAETTNQSRYCPNP